MNGSDTESIIEQCCLNKKRKRNPETYKRNQIKSAIIKGQNYINHKGKNVAAKQFGSSCGCKRNCLGKIGEENVNDTFNKFYKISGKNEQDLYIQGLIDVLPVKQKRPRNDMNSRLNSASFKYHLIIGTDRIEVCIKAFIAAFDISIKRVRRIRDLKLAGNTPEDKRGKHISFTLPLDTKIKIRKHIETFPLKNSHYSGKKIQYLSADLDIKCMYNLFKEKYPDIKVSYMFYYTYFKDNFNYKFGRPQVDTCCVCEELKLKIKSPHLNETAKRAAVAELIIHKRRSNKFYSSLQYETKQGREEHQVISIAFDYMQIISLPKVPVQELFYLRQLSVNCFCIHNIKECTSQIFIYHEGEGKRGPDEVCSFLFEYLNNLSSRYTEVRLFSDNCPGQNKNQTISRFLLALTDSGRFKKIQHFFPVRGHSYLPCDRDFGTIKRTLRKHDRLYNIHEITELIIKSGKAGKFTVKEVNANDISNYKEWWGTYYKKYAVSEETAAKPRNERIQFGISALYHFVYDSERQGYISAYPFINGLEKQTFFMKSARENVNIPPQNKAYPSGKVSIKQNKLNDLEKIVRYIREEDKPFYTYLLNWPSTSAEEDDL